MDEKSIKTNWSPNDLPHPFSFYKIILNSDMLHFGYWEAEKEDIGLEEAQQSATELLLKQLPKAPARILDIGCGLGATSQHLHNLGYEVVAIAPDKTAIDYAKAVNPGPHYFITGFLDDHPMLEGNEKYDVVLMQESLQYFPEIQTVFSKIKKLIKDENSRILICDEVSYDEATKEFSVVKQVEEIEKAFHNLGFYVDYHKMIGNEVAHTCTETLLRFEEKRQLLMDTIDDAGEHLDNYINGWRQQEKAYQNGTMGYEVWSLRLGEISTRNYQLGDESKILETFNKTFNVSRSPEHWIWKFKDNPLGGPFTSLSWDGDKIAAQYTGYPLKMDIGDNRDVVVFQNGDTMVVPEYRGVGIGRNNLLSRTFRFFERNVMPGDAFVAYGFNTGKIRRLCQLFLGITVDLPIYEWNFSINKESKFNSQSWFQQLLSGLSISKETSAGNWANEIFQNTRKDYPWLIKRDRKYLEWRYDQHPDFSYAFYVVKHWGKPVGWLVVRQEGEKLFLVDALLDKQKAKTALEVALQKIIKNYPEIDTISSWFSEVPEWWNKLLANAGFEKQRQFQDLYLACKSYDKRVTTQKFAEKFYFTMGDSDLY
jgi:cyclopropane fatty-acyl-phospholipid synthase-like methyltransferase